MCLCVCINIITTAYHISFVTTYAYYDYCCIASSSSSFNNKKIFPPGLIIAVDLDSKKLQLGYLV